MIRLLELKKKELCEFVDIEKTSKIKSVKDQVSYLSCKIQKTTGLLQYCVETLKEQDPSSFLLISENMITRMSDIENKFPQDGDLQPKVELDFDILLNSDAIYKEIKKLSYKQNKVPSAPVFLAEQCQTSSSLTDSTIILAWNNKLGGKNNVQGYLLEIDDGTPDSSFKEVYCGTDNICQINGLSANLVYNARVKSFNQAGFSEYSNIISLAASPTLWFSFNPKTSHNDAIFSNNFTSLTCMSFEDRVILGSIGFSKGIHYWEVTIDRYDNQPDPAFGVARYDVGKEHMLGKDNKSWCMYIDCKRSWFMHSGKHFNRIDNGIQQGCVIGILLDLNRYQLSYFVNDEPHGNVAFTKLPKGVYYPAFSLNKNVQITLNSGLEPPPSLDNSDCD
jgi:tripartite motif-containing protein 9/67